MTVPKISTVKRGGSRYYIDPVSGKKLPGVTSVIGAGVAKPFLQYWASGLVAEAAVDMAGSWIGLALKGDRQGAVDYLKRAPGRFTSTAATRGTEAHGIWELMATPVGKGPGRVHPDMQWAVDSFQEFVDAFKPEFTQLEATVFQPHDANGMGGYAGSFDALATIGGERVLLDFKSGKNVYPEVALQLHAYAAAESIMNPDGSTIPMPAVDALAVFHSHPGKDWALVPVAFDYERFFQVFAACLVIHNFSAVGSKAVLGVDIDPVVWAAEQAAGQA
jgi:hypothetical protein